MRYKLLFFLCNENELYDLLSSLCAGYSCRASFQQTSFSICNHTNTSSVHEGGNWKEASGCWGETWGNSIYCHPLFLICIATENVFLYSQANRSINEVSEKISQAEKKRQEIITTFVSKTKEQLDQKLEDAQEKREALMDGLKNKLKDHVRAYFVLLSVNLLHQCLFTPELVGARRESTPVEWVSVAGDSNADWREAEICWWEAWWDTQAATGEASGSCKLTFFIVNMN